MFTQVQVFLQLRDRPVQGVPELHVDAELDQLRGQLQQVGDIALHLIAKVLSALLKDKF